MKVSGVYLEHIPGIGVAVVLGKMILWDQEEDERDWDEKDNDYTETVNAHFLRVLSEWSTGHSPIPSTHRADNKHVGAYDGPSEVW